jgi:hypothetical protein
LEQCNAWQANQSDALSVEDEHLTSIGISRVHGSRHEVQRDDGNNVTLNHNTEYTPAETSSQSHADINIIASEENTLERAGGGSKVTQFAGGCTRMFPLRVEEGPGADTHMMLSYGGAIRSEADWNKFTAWPVSSGASTAYSFDQVFGTKSLTDEVCQPSFKVGSSKNERSMVAKSKSDEPFRYFPHFDSESILSCSRFQPTFGLFYF